MPTYEYRCDACEHTWDEFQPITSKPTKKCPQCRKAKAKRLISAGGGLIFKGSGFYLTDYRSDSYKKAADADAKSSAPPTDSKPSSSEKSESKPGSASKSSDAKSSDKSSK